MIIIIPILLTVGAQIHGLRWGVRSPLARERREMNERRERGGKWAGENERGRKMKVKGKKKGEKLRTEG